MAGIKSAFFLIVTVIISSIANEMKPPRIINSPQVLEVALGQTARFYCSAVGHPEPVLRWYFNGDEVKTNGNSDKSHFYTINNDGGELVIKADSVSAQGKYCCVADNRISDFGTDRVCNILYMEHAPAAYIRPKRLVVKELSTATLHCVITGRPKPVVTWYLNEETLPCIINPTCINIEAQGSRLTINNASLSHTGKYRCAAWNVLGTATAISSVIVRPSEKTTTTLAETTQRGNRSLSYLAINLLIALLLACSAIFLVYFLRRRKMLCFKVVTRVRSGTELERIETFPSRENKLKALRYPHDRLQFVEEIGQGLYGKVYKALAPGLASGDFVAVKTFQNRSDGGDMYDEVKLLVDYAHPHIVQLLGVCLSTHRDKSPPKIDSHKLAIPPPPYILFEYIGGGDLCSFLRGNPLGGAEERRRVSFCAQIASGMRFLEEKRFVHRDLATRNCLIDPVNDIVKISDFGLSRSIYSCDYYKAGGNECVPVRWMATESILYNRFSHSSDIWAFGVVMWEVYTNAIQPYCGLSNADVIEAVVAGKILSKPVLAPTWCYNLMRLCWNARPDERPNFETVCSVLETVLNRCENDN